MVDATAGQVPPTPITGSLPRPDRVESLASE